MPSPISIRHHIYPSFPCSLQLELIFKWDTDIGFIIQIQIMRFKIRNLQGQTRHDDMCTSVSWCSFNELTSVGDDNVIYRWNVNASQATKWLQLDSYAVDHDWMPFSKGASELLAVGFADGSIKLINKNGKVEKHITADTHKKSVIALKWSYDGGALATTGQDGSLKIWSKNGNLRTNLVSSDKPIYSVAWSPESDALLYAFDKFIALKPISANQQKNLQWKAHEGLVLKVDWSPNNNSILSCGEDCRYKVWDNYGRLLYSSSPYDYVVNSIGWSPNGDYFAVGAFGMFKICDKTGWTYSFSKLENGSVEKVTWSADGTLCAGACGDGNVVFGEVVDKQVGYNNWEATLNDENRIEVTDILSENVDFQEHLDFKDRVINMSIGWGNLIAATASQCYIYNIPNWNTPHIFDLKDSVAFIIQSQKYFCLIESTNGIMVHSYQGKLISNPKIAGAKFEFMSRKKIAISSDIIAVIESTNSKMIRFYEIATGKALNFTVEHTLPVIEINLNQVEQSLQRKIAFLDANRDLYLTTVHKAEKSVKVATICDSFSWHDKFEILISVSDNRLSTFFYPSVVFIDPDLLQLTTTNKDAPELGRLPQILTYCETLVTIRRRDGGVITVSNSPYPTILLDFCEKGKWEKATKLCRFVKEPLLWACLAAASLKYKKLESAETAFAAIEIPQKVVFLSELRDSPSEIVRNASLALLFHKNTEAEQIYTQNKFYYRAIRMHIDGYRWERALKLARDYKVHLDTVVAFRKKYLQRIGKEEDNKELVKASQEVGEVDWTAIEAKIAEEIEKEKKK